MSLIEKIKNIVGAIEINRDRINFMNSAINGRLQASAYSIGDCRRKLPLVIQEGRELKRGYQKLTARRYTSLVISRYWKSDRD